MSRRALAVALSMLLSAAVSAQQHPNQKKGFNPNDVYQFNGVDAINAFNGNLTLTIPIGGEYSVGGGLTYSFVLHANANLWEGEQHCHKNAAGHCITVCPSTNHLCSSEEKDLPTYMFPHRRANAGLGWTLSFGRLYQPSHPAMSDTGLWTWESPSGADHTFANDSGILSMSKVGEDDSYLRMTEQTDGMRRIEFPDGTIHIYGPPDTLQDFWALRRITNRFSSNYVDFQYEAMASPAGLRWIVTDSHGRSHRVEALRMQHDSFWRQFVTKVALSVHGSDVKAEASLEYTAQALGRPADHTDSFEHPDDFPNDHLRTAAPTQLLSKVAFPDGTNYQFTYRTGNSLNGTGYPLTMTLPTGGSIAWMWEVYSKPWSSADAGEPYLRYSLGVSRRKMLDRSGLVAGERTYIQGGDCNFYNQDDQDNICREVVSTITDLEGGLPKQATKSYFSVARQILGTLPPWSELEYGKPFTHNLSDGTPDPMTRWLSTRTLDENGHALRSTYVRFEGNPLRQVSSRVTFGPDGQTYLDTDSSDWDGYGHYRTVTTSGNVPDTPARVVTTHYLPPQPYSPMEPYPPTQPPPAWLTGLYDFQTVQENGTTLRTEFCFDPNTGFLQRKRTLKEATPGPADLLAVYLPDARGNVANERYYGGDTTPGVGTTGSLCGVTPGSLAYEIQHIRTEPTQSADGSIVSKYPANGVEIANITIDRRSGRVVRSQDMVGIETRYEYDWAGRVTWEKPAGRAWSHYEYLPNGLFEIRETRYPNGQWTGPSLTWSKYHLDGFGRVDLETVAMPGGGESRRATAYDAFGRKGTVSELGSASSLPVTTFVYDALGRVLKATAPDGKITRFIYTGDHIKTRVGLVWTGSHEAEFATSEEYDGYGRLVAVTENAGTGIDTIRTEYRYNPANLLVDVKMKGGGAGTVVQNRVFDYDGRGFLRWESHPESGVTSYSYDARGHVRSKEIGAAKTTFDLLYTYDAAERLVSVKGRSAQNSVDFRPIKEFTYGPPSTSVPPDRRAGKLVKAVRYNYPPGGGSYLDGIIKVAETYDYADPAGRKTDRNTEIALSDDGVEWTTVREFSQTAGYDELDNRTSTDYPLCLDCGLATPTGAAARVITATHDRGYLTTLSDFVSSIDYWPNGVRKDMVHTNSIVDKQTIDTATMLPRPRQLSSEPYCASPVISALSPPVTVASPPAQLSVTATGVGPMTYQWFSFSDGAIPGATAATFAVPEADAYYVEVSNTCGTKRSGAIRVTIGGCVAASFHSVTATQNVVGTFTLRASTEGSQPISYRWFRGGSSTPFATAADVVTDVIAATTHFAVEASNSCGPAVTRTVTAAIPLSFPAGGALTAAVEGSGTRVRWPAVAGPGVTYVVQRRAAATPWQTLVQSLTGLTYLDTAVTAQQAYAYRAIATASGHANSPPSNADVALMTTFTTVASGSPVAAANYVQLLAAVNAVRAVAGWSAITWSGMLSASDPLPAVGQAVVVKHIVGLQLRMNEALQALGVPVSGYSACGPQQPIRAIHLTELQQRVQ